MATKLHPAIKHLNATKEFVASEDNINALNNLVEAVLAEQDEKYCTCSSDPCWPVGGRCVTCNKPISR